MKDFRGMKRQRNRNRKPSSGNQSNPNRAYESNGPEGTKVRGNAQTIYEKYQQLARDANSSGDRVLAENHLQHAEHYFRMIRQMQPQRPVAEFVQRDPLASPFDDFDEDYEGDNAEAETEAADASQMPEDNGAQRYDRNRNDQKQRDYRGNGNNGYRNNEPRNNDQRSYEPRNQEPRYQEPRHGEPRNNDQRSYEPRNPEPRNNEPRSFEPRVEGDAGRRETRRERYERRRTERLTDQEVNLNGSFAPQTPQPAAPFVASTQPLGVPAGRAPLSLTEAAPPQSLATPMVDTPTTASPDASHLPAFLSRPAPIAAADAPVAEAAPVKPKRTYTRKPKATAE